MARNALYTDQAAAPNDKTFTVRLNDDHDDEMEALDSELRSFFRSFFLEAQIYV